MNEDKKIYGHFIIEFFDDSKIFETRIGIGIRDEAYIAKDAPAPIKQSLKKILTILHKNYPMLIIAESDEIKKGKKQ